MRALTTINRAIKMLLVIFAAVLAPVRGSSNDGENEKVSAGADAASISGINAKLKLLEKFTSTPATLERIAKSGNADAKRHLEAATAAQQEASDALDGGELERAAAAIREGYGHMTAALRAAKDVSKQLRQDAERYETLRQRVFSFSEAFQRIAYEKNDPAIFQLLDQERVDNLLLQAQSLAVAGEHASANEHMKEVSAIVEKALSVARDRETLLHELTFATPEAEYDYELRRNDSYALLVKLLEQNPDTPAGALEAMRRAVEKNESVRQRAEESFSRGDVEKAVATLEESSNEVSRVLRWSGLAF